MKLGVLKKEETGQGIRENLDYIPLFLSVFFIYGFYMELRGVRSDWLAGRI